MQKGIEIRPANFQDYSALAKFLSFEFFIHRHLDWRTALDWLGRQPFLIAERNSEIMACFAAPKEVEDTAWVRLFACSALIDREEIWHAFFREAVPMFDPQVRRLAALGIDNWFIHLIEKTNFFLAQEIIVLERNEMSLPNHQKPAVHGVFLRLMDAQDLAPVADLDAQCFPPLWQMPLETMKLAFLQSGYATVIEHENRIVGYQITTEALSSVHLARIAVQPQLQKTGLAGWLLHDVISHYLRQGVLKITVNTQDDNHPSRTLYQKFGFRQTAEHYPVYAYEIPRPTFENPLT